MGDNMCKANYQSIGEISCLKQYLESILRICYPNAINFIIKDRKLKVIYIIRRNQYFLFDEIEVPYEYSFKEEIIDLTGIDYSKYDFFKVEKELEIKQFKQKFIISYGENLEYTAVKFILKK